MEGTHETDRTPEDEGALDLRGAAALLTQTQERAHRELDFRSPWLTLLAAAVVLVALGTVWLSVRGQHPYRGPNAEALVVLYALVLIRICSVVYSHRRASAGVTGRSVSRRRARESPWRWP